MAQPKIHILYIFTYDDPSKAEEDKKMLNVLQFINENVETINEMGIKIQTQRYTAKQILGDKNLAEKLRREITVFPSIKTPNSTYNGFEDIQKVYMTNIRNFKKFETKHEKPTPVEDVGEGDLEEHMRRAINQRDDDEDDENAESLSGGKGLSSQVSAAMAARNTKPSKPIRGVDMPREPSNVKPNREPIQATISRLTQARSPQQTETTIRGGGSLGADDDGGPRDGDSFKDDDMARKYAENNELSM